MRTGNMRRARRNGGWEDYVGTDEPGFGIEVLPWLHEHDIAGVAIDNWGFEALPSGHPTIWLPVHAVAVVHMGCCWARTSASRSSPRTAPPTACTSSCLWDCRCL